MGQYKHIGIGGMALLALSSVLKLLGTIEESDALTMISFPIQLFGCIGLAYGIYKWAEDIVTQLKMMNGEDEKGKQRPVDPILAPDVPKTANWVQVGPDTFQCTKCHEVYRSQNGVLPRICPFCKSDVKEILQRK